MAKNSTSHNRKTKQSASRERSHLVPDGIDNHVGRRLKQRRLFLGLTQQDLAARVQLTYQQIQKYETGANRFTASRLFDLALALGVRASWFFEDYGAPATDLASTTQEQQYSSRETAELLHAYYRMTPARQRLLFALTTGLASQEPSASEAGSTPG
jgi:transcriptional regulator with XRE-family HTH domain